MQAPIYIHLFWKNTDPKISEYVNLLYNLFRRDPKNPSDRYIGIPTFLYPYIPELAELKQEEAVQHAYIFLVDDPMILDKAWRTFMLELKNAIQKTNALLVPVAISQSLHALPEEIKKHQFVRLFEQKDLEKGPFLLNSIAHVICRLLYSSKKQFAKNKMIAPAPRQQLFLSHTKRDGTELVEALEHRISTYPGLEAFLDTKDLPAGEEFAQQIELEIDTSILVVHYTDQYSISEWGMREIIKAKAHLRPIVVVNRYQKGTRRGSPYIGNLPHLHKEAPDNDPQLLDYIILGALREAVRVVFVKKMEDTIAQAMQVRVDQVLALPPTLDVLALLKNRPDLTEKETIVFVYPDPPLAAYEDQYLQGLLPTNLTLTTPAMLAMGIGHREPPLKGFRVSFSLSETDLGTFTWIKNRYLQDLMVELIRYLMAGGATLIYSGMVGYQQKSQGEKFDFAELLFDLVRLYKKSYTDPRDDSAPLHNYRFYPIYAAPKTSIDAATKADLQPYVQFHPVSPPEELKVPATSTIANQILAFKRFPDRYVWAKSLTCMRETMLQQADVHISLGGKWNNFKGKMPGVLEEIFLALKLQKPVFLIGGFGGATRLVIDLISGQEELLDFNLDFFKNLYPDYYDFILQFNEHTLTKDSEKVDYEEIKAQFRRWFPVVETSDRYQSLHNGLTDTENERLFFSQNEIEIITLILKGLKNLNTHG